jgi:hypothetical protein
MFIMPLASYYPDRVNVLVAGFIPMKGYIDGTFVQVSKDLMPFTSVRTADGTVTRLYNSAQSYSIQITLASGSESNDVLTKLWQLDEITQKGKFPILIKDQSGSDLFFSPTAWIEQIPTMNKSTKIDDRVWMFRAVQGTINIGGNAEPSDLINDLVNIASSALPILEGVL